MVNDVRTFLYAGMSRRISSIAFTAACILSSFPQPAICLLIEEPEFNELVSDSITHISDCNSGQLIERFDKLEMIIQSSRDPLHEGRKFLQSFIEEINIRNGLNLTLHDACVLVRQNLHTLQIPPEVQNILLETISLLECDSSSTTEQIQHFGKVMNMNALGLKVSWPWYWFKANKKIHKPSKQAPSISFATPPALQIAGANKELPSTVLVGGIEAFSGALVFTLGLVFPPAYGVGSALMVDGTRRVLNGLEEMDKQRPLGSNQPPGQPSGPLNYNF